MSGRITAMDWSRGLLIILMALDHTSLYWNQNRLHDEGLNGFYQIAASWGQFLTRFLSHPCAPGFMFISGLALFISMQKQNERGKSLLSQNLHYLFRGISLIAIDFILVNRLGWTFGVLACIGVCTIILAQIRFISARWILALSLSLLIFHPCMANLWETDTIMGSYFSHVFASAGRLGKNLAVLYPVIPWIGIIGMGYGFAAYIWPLWLQGKSLLISKIFFKFGIALIALFFPLRIWTGGFYQDYSPYQGIFSQSFWLLSKYPPSLTFLSWNMGWFFIWMGVFFSLKKESNTFLKVLQVFGQAPLFFYVIHRYFYKFFPDITGTLREYSLGTTYVIWAAGLIPLYFLCLGYQTIMNRRNY